MKLTLKRIALRPTYTIGKLYIDDAYFCDTLEDTVRDTNKSGKFDNGEQKIKGKTAIPYGTYEIKWTYSPRFKKYTPQLMNVPSLKAYVFTLEIQALILKDVSFSVKTNRLEKSLTQELL